MTCKTPGYQDCGNCDVADCVDNIRTQNEAFSSAMNQLPVNQLPMNQLTYRQYEMARREVGDDPQKIMGWMDRKFGKDRESSDEEFLEHIKQYLAKKGGSL